GAAKIVEVIYILRAEIDLQRRKYVGRREAQLLRLQTVDIGVDRWRAGIEKGEHAREGRILVGGGDKRACGLGQGLGTQTGTVLQQHLEAAGAAEALHGRRRDLDDIGVLDDRQAPAQIGQNGVGVHAWKVMIVKRRQAGEDGCRIRCDREGR